jgi:hypothetical protein
MGIERTSHRIHLQPSQGPKWLQAKDRPFDLVVPMLYTFEIPLPELIQLLTSRGTNDILVSVLKAVTAIGCFAQT